MTRLFPLLLVAACACPAEYVECDPVTDLCVCTGPAGTVAAEAPDDRDRKPEPLEEREKSDLEPDSETDPDGYRDWKERRG